MLSSSKTAPPSMPPATTSTARNQPNLAFGLSYFSDVGPAEAKPTPKLRNCRMLTGYVYVRVTHQPGVTVPLPVILVVTCGGLPL